MDTKRRKARIVAKRIMSPAQWIEFRKMAVADARVRRSLGSNRKAVEK